MATSPDFFTIAPVLAGLVLLQVQLKLSKNIKCIYENYINNYAKIAYFTTLATNAFSFIHSQPFRQDARRCPSPTNSPDVVAELAFAVNFIRIDTVGLLRYRYQLSVVVFRFDLIFTCLLVFSRLRNGLLSLMI